MLLLHNYDATVKHRRDRNEVFWDSRATSFPFQDVTV